MKHFYQLLILSVFFLIHIISIHAQCPTDLSFDSQNEIDDFIINYPNCTIVNGNILISEGASVFDITNVDGFANLTSINGNITFDFLPELTNVDGFSNLVSVDGWLSMNTLQKLTDLMGFSSLNTVSGNTEFIALDLIPDLQGLDNLESIGGNLVIQDCDNLTSLNGLENLKSADWFNFNNNDAFVSMSAVNNVIAYGSSTMSLLYNVSMGDCVNDFVCEFLAPGAFFDGNQPPCTALFNPIDFCPFLTIAPGIIDQCQTLDAVEISEAEGNTYKADIVDASGNIVCTIEADGNTLGSTVVELYTSSVTRFYDGIAYMNRDISIIPEFQPVSDVSVKFYFTAQDFADLQAADPSITTIEDINFTKFDGGCTGSYNGGGSQITQISSNEHGVNGDWWVRVVIPSFSSFIASGTNFPLPVELIKFEGELKEDNVKLTWTTATEINNDYFIIQHTENGEDFLDIGTVKGQGNSTIEQQYSYSHNVTGSLENYYRLKQVDYNGKYRYSSIIHISNSKPSFTYAPNPSEGFIRVFSKFKNEDISVEISDLFGNVKIMQKVEEGATIDISKLPAGMYNLRLGNQSNTSRIVKI